MKMLIGGAWSEGSGGDVIKVTNPSDLTTVDTVPSGDADDISAAVDAAQDAFVEWSAVPARERGMVLRLVAERVRASVDELATLLTREQGKPFLESKGEFLGFANVLDYHASVSGTLHGKTLELQGIGDGLTLREPLGVCGAIIPWNMPVLIMAWKAAPALVTGNTLVIKPASDAPLSCLRLASILQDSGVPDGAINIVTGGGIEAGEPLAFHPGVRKLSFTGASSTGKRVASVAAPTLKRMTLELGGSDPAIVCSDADIEKTAEGIIAARFYNCGQACTSLKRLYVMDEVADTLAKRLVDKASSLKMDDGLREGTRLGPLVNASQQEAMGRFMKDLGDRDQGTVLCGGEAPERMGHFFPATVVDHTDPDSRMMREELFGPILPIVRVGDLDEALEMANRSPYGLGASIWSQDLRTVRRCIKEFRTGMVWVNTHLRVPVEAPFGGVGDSGLGRENGTESLDSYLEWKTVILG